MASRDNGPADAKRHPDSKPWQGTGTGMRFPRAIFMGPVQDLVANRPRLAAETSRGT